MINIRQLSLAVGIALCLALPSNAQTPYKDNAGKYGYKDAAGNIIIKPKFEVADDFFEGLAAVKYNGKYGYINNSGSFVIQPQFEGRGKFTKCGLAAAKLGGKWGYITKAGKFLIQPKYDNVTNFGSNEFAAVEQNEKWGYINTTGYFVIKPQFDDAYAFADNGLAIVELNGKQGYINEYGKFVIQPQFERAYNFQSNGLASVCINGKWGYINSTGEIVIQPQFDKTYTFQSNGLASVCINGKWGCIDSTGKIVIRTQFDDIYVFQSNGLATVKLNGKFGCIDTSGRIVVLPRYDDIYKFSYNGLASVKLNGKWGYVNTEGKVVAQPQFDKTYRFANDGLAVVVLNGKYGYIDSNGRMVIQARFDDVFDFSDEGIAKVKYNGKDGWIDGSGIFYTTKAQALNAVESKYRIIASESYKTYVYRYIPTWESYLQRHGIVKPAAPSAESVRQSVESKVNAWQKKGEFESTAEWHQRVNDETRAKKIDEVTAAIQADYNKKIADYNTKTASLKATYSAEYKKVSDRYCKAKAKKFASQTFVLKPYDADNETFLITTATDGDILLPVPKAKAPQFKTNWNTIKQNVTAEYVPNGNNVALKSVTFGNYTYDGNTNANYAVTSVDYNFAPIEISDIDFDNADYKFAPTDETKSTKTISTTHVSPQTKRISAGSASDVDINIPQGRYPARNTFAIVIANESYKNVEVVENAANDGKIMAKYLNRTIGIPEKQVFTYINATYGDMIDALDMISNIAKAYGGSNFNVIYYYAGHGVPDEYSHEAYLLPIDGKPGSASVNLPLSNLYDRLGSLGASSVYVMLDACFSGAQRGDGMLAMARGVAIKAKSAELHGNMVVLSAAQGDETAYPYNGKSHGMFTYFLLKKLQETSGNVTFGELSDYVIDKVRKTSVIENNGKIQTPTVRTSFSASNLWRTRRFNQ